MQQLCVRVSSIHQRERKFTSLLSRSQGAGNKFVWFEVGYLEKFIIGEASYKHVTRKSSIDCRKKNVSFYPRPNGLTKFRRRERRKHPVSVKSTLWIAARSRWLDCRRRGDRNTNILSHNLAPTWDKHFHSTTIKADHLKDRKWISRRSETSFIMHAIGVHRSAGHRFCSTINYRF